MFSYTQLFFTRRSFVASPNQDSTFSHSPDYNPPLRLISDLSSQEFITDSKLVYYSFVNPVNLKPQSRTCETALTF